MFETVLLMFFQWYNIFLFKDRSVKIVTVKAAIILNNLVKLEPKLLIKLWLELLCHLAIRILLLRAVAVRKLAVPRNIVSVLEPVINVVSTVNVKIVSTVDFIYCFNNIF